MVVLPGPRLCSDKVTASLSPSLRPTWRDHSWTWLQPPSRDPAVQMIATSEGGCICLVLVGYESISVDQLQLKLQGLMCICLVLVGYESISVDQLQLKQQGLMYIRSVHPRPPPVAPPAPPPVHPRLPPVAPPAPPPVHPRLPPVAPPAPPPVHPRLLLDSMLLLHLPRFTLNLHPLLLLPLLPLTLDLQVHIF